MHALEDHNDIFIDVQDKTSLLKKKREGESGRTKTYDMLRVGFPFTDQIPCDSSAIFLSSLQT